MNFEKKYHKYKAKLLAERGSVGGTQTEGVIDTPSYKIYVGYTRDDKFIRVSPFHGIPLYPNYDHKNIVNMIVEIPKGTQDKLEITKEEPLNPIMYDLKNDRIRRITYQAVLTDQPGYPFHYGALPQTWEDNGHLDPRTISYGDNDPIDAFDISNVMSRPGMIKRVKILGAFAMIDDDETDWKLICIDLNDPDADNYQDIHDVPKSYLEIMEDFLRRYKTPEGKAENTFAPKMIWNSQETRDIVEEVHEFWNKLVTDRDSVANNSLSRGSDAQQDVLNIQIQVEE